MLKPSLHLIGGCVFLCEVLLLIDHPWFSMMSSSMSLAVITDPSALLTTFTFVIFCFLFLFLLLFFIIIPFISCSYFCFFLSSLEHESHFWSHTLVTVTLWFYLSSSWCETLPICSSVMRPWVCHHLGDHRLSCIILMICINILSSFICRICPAGSHHILFDLIPVTTSHVFPSLFCFIMCRVISDHSDHCFYCLIRLVITTSTASLRLVIMLPSHGSWRITLWSQTTMFSVVDVGDQTSRCDLSCRDTVVSSQWVTTHRSSVSRPTGTRSTNSSRLVRNPILICLHNALSECTVLRFER